MLKSLENAVDKVNTDLTNVDGVAEILGTSSMYTRKLLEGAAGNVENTKVHGRTFYVIADVEKWAKQRGKDAEAKAKASEERIAKKAEGKSSRSGPTLKELREQAKEAGIKKYHHLSKTDLIAAIEAGPPPEETKTEKTEKSGDEPKPPTLAELRKQAKTLAATLGVSTPKGNKAKIQAWLAEAEAEAGDIKPEAETKTEDEDDTELTLEDMLSS